MTGMKAICHKFYNTVYRQYILIIFDKEKFKSLTGGEELLTSAGGCCAVLESGLMLMWLEMDEKGKIEMTDAAHESFHAADFLLDSVGMEYSHDTGNEHMAYLIGWMMGCVLQAQHTQQINDGIIYNPKKPTITTHILKEGDDIAELLEKSANEWDEKCHNDPTDGNLTEIRKLLNQDSLM
jgi:hypothetical protein